MQKKMTLNLHTSFFFTIFAAQKFLNERITNNKQFI
jgi:hypothetical protein